jgi:hypothetical protein
MSKLTEEFAQTFKTPYVKRYETTVNKFMSTRTRAAAEAEVEALVSKFCKCFEIVQQQW